MVNQLSCSVAVFNYQVSLSVFYCFPETDLEVRAHEEGEGRGAESPLSKAAGCYLS